MTRQYHGWSRAQAEDQAKVATQSDASSMPDQAPNYVGTRAKTLPVAEGLIPNMQGVGRHTEIPSMREMLNKPPPEPTVQGAGRRSFTNKFKLPPSVGIPIRGYQGQESGLGPRQQSERERHAEASRRQSRARASTSASDEINWGSDPSPVSGEPSRPRPGFARTQDMMEGLEGRPPELHARGASEIPPEDSVMQTCEPEGRDTMLALKAQRQEYLTTEERRLDELVQAEDRIRELEQVNEVLASIISDNIYLSS
ncbi:MAG: hypothetical protein Q9213_004232 [Squamulea squamosa]